MAIKCQSLISIADYTLRIKGLQTSGAARTVPGAESYEHSCGFNDADQRAIPIFMVGCHTGTLSGYLN
jgi:hypothetical protein